MKHVNTGCTYSAEGQRITIIDLGDRSIFVDHTRMVDGLVKGRDLSTMAVMSAYVKSEYGFVESSVDRARMRKVEMEYREMADVWEWVDISKAYRYNTIYGW